MTLFEKAIHFEKVFGWEFPIKVLRWTSSSLIKTALKTAYTVDSLCQCLNKSAISHQF